MGLGMGLGMGFLPWYGAWYGVFKAKSDFFGVLEVEK